MKSSTMRAPVQPTPLREVEGLQHEPVRVLILEDDRVSAEIFAAYVRRTPWAKTEPQIAATLAEALALLEQGPFDLIVSDLHVPDSKGVATVARLSGAGRLIIAMTSDEDPQLRDGAMAAGAYDFVHKSQLGEAALQRLVRLAAIQAKT